MKKNNMPEIRFAGFSGDWEERTLEQILKINSGRDYKHLSVGNIPVYGTGGYMLSVNDKLSDQDSIGIGRKGTIDKPQLLKAPFWTVDTLFYMTVQGENSLIFCYSLANRIQWKKYDESTGVPSLSKSTIDKIVINIPSLKEQTQIGNFFKQLDDTIATHLRELKHLKQTKQGFLQKMFPKEGETVPEIRFSGFSGDWEERKLGEMLSSMKSGLSRMLSTNDIGLPVIRANNINDGVLDLENDIKYWYEADPQGADIQNYLVNKNDILVNFINSESKMGTATIVHIQPKRRTIYTTNIMNLRTNIQADSYYIFCLTNTKKYKDYVKLITKPAVNQSSFTTVDFKNFKFRAPLIHEQTLIGNFFKQLDDTIALHKRELETLKQTKKAFLQKMFV